VVAEKQETNWKNPGRLTTGCILNKRQVESLILLKL